MGRTDQILWSLSRCCLRVTTVIGAYLGHLPVILGTLAPLLSSDYRGVEKNRNLCPLQYKKPHNAPKSVWKCAYYTDLETPFFTFFALLSPPFILLCPLECSKLLFHLYIALKRLFSSLSVLRPSFFTYLPLRVLYCPFRLALPLLTSCSLVFVPTAFHTIQTPFTDRLCLFFPVPRCAEW